MHTNNLHSLLKVSEEANKTLLRFYGSLDRVCRLPNKNYIFSKWSRLNIFNLIHRKHAH